MKKSIFLFIGIIGLVSFTGAQTWQAPQRLTWDSEHSCAPVLAVGTGNDLYITWTSKFSEGEIYYKKSTDNGASWGPINRLTWSPNNSVACRLVSQANNRLHLVWEERLSDDYEIFYKRSNLFVLLPIQ